MTERIRYIDEVCTALLDDTERKYIMARTNLEQVTAASTMPQEKHADQIEAARKTCPVAQGEMKIHPNFALSANNGQMRRKIAL